MDPHRTPHPKAPRAASVRIAALVALLWAVVLAPGAAAQSLPELLPEDVVAAIGFEGLADQEARLAPFLEEAERLGLYDSVASAVPSDVGPAAEGADGEIPDLPPALAELEPLDLLGQEFWVAVSASAFRPLPAVTVIARPNEAAADAFATVIDEASGRPGVERLEEGGRTLWTYVAPADASDSFDVPIAYAQASEGVLVASSDPEIVRFVLRALDGSGDATMADSDVFASLRSLGDGIVFGLLDAAPLTRPLEPFAASFEAGPLLARVRDALLTAGPSVGVVRATDEGLESESLLRPDPDGPDPALYALLTEGTTAGTEVLAFAPDDAVMVGASTVDLAGWWAWLDDVMASGASLGLPSATELVSMFGIDLQATLFDWMGTSMVQVFPSVAVAADVGMAQEGLATPQVFLFEAMDDEAARQGLDTLLSTLGPSLAAFGSPSGGAMAAPETVQVAGQDVQRLPVADTLSVDVAVVDGWAMLSLMPEATEAVLSAYAADDAPPAAFADVAASLDAPVRAWTISDDTAAVRGTSVSLVSQLQLLAGLGGAGTLDFDAVDEASGDVAAWLEFLAERLGTSSTVTRVEDEGIRTEGFTPVDW